jgi:hypothetical protein
VPYTHVEEERAGILVSYPQRQCNGWGSLQLGLFERKGTGWEESYPIVSSSKSLSYSIQTLKDFFKSYITNTLNNSFIIRPRYSPLRINNLTPNPYIKEFHY